MSRIKVLDQHIVNKIAAGEVVERPASVVKEMMENAMDAGASRITLEVEDGGKKLIRITDNGCGMDRSDLELAFAPHATSKIATDEDLFSIATFGFRGEALASIASVSQVEVLSRSAEAIEGARLTISGGDCSPIEPAPAAPGTIITVRNLFFNTPARRKFLRTANTEMGHITEQFTRIALAHTQVQLTLIHNGKKTYELPAGQSLHERIGILFSPEISNGLFSIDRDSGDFGIKGLIAHPRHSRANNQWQYIFLNGRHIKDRFISHAIREAYRGMMEINRQPIVFLFIQLPPQKVDVNVHPAKTEVRFADSNFVHSLVLATIRDRLLSSDLSITMGIDSFATGKQDTKQAPESSARDKQDHQDRVRQAMADFFKSAPPTHQPVSGPPSDTRPATATPETSSPVKTTAKPRQQQYDMFPAFKDNVPRLEEQTTPAGGDQVHSLNQESLTDILQVHKTYLVTETQDGLVIIDQHALHERIVYEKLSRQLSNGPLTSQRCLIPEVVDVTDKQMAMLEEHQPILADLGITTEQFGPRSIAIQSFPMLLDKVSPPDFVMDLLDLLEAQAGKATRDELIHHVLDMMACKAAIKAGDGLSEGEIKALLAQRDLVEQSGTCPHGRPTSIRLTLNELEKQFKRT
ncbi:MAG: DNA mismatch repair endonuclease MutL [Sedimentisphaerales bacterium]|nr:DNA mismatch repair endonuclease MutL [Sedimentisphaerales bacterium]